MNKSEIISAFKSFYEYNILVVGDSMIDSYMWGTVDRISPEAPIPVVAIEKKENRLGGAANVALNIRALGANPVLCSVIGNDDSSRIFFDLLDKRGLTPEGIIVSNERITTTKNRILSRNQHLLRVDEEIDDYISEETEAEFIERTEQLISKYHIDAILFEDYDKGVITPGLIEKVVSKANKEKILTVADPKRKNFSNYNNISLFKPNFREFSEGLKINIEKNDYEGIFSASKDFLKSSKIGLLLITLSELGIYAGNGSNYEVIPAEIRDISDVSGAGDTVVSIATLCLISEMSLTDIAKISNIAGGLVCEKVGVVPVEKEQLYKKVLRSYNF